MNIKKMWVSILIVLSLALLVSAASAQTINIADGSAETGASTTLTITADTVVDLANFDITITYDPAVVIVTDAENDDAFGAAINNLEDAANGTVRLASLNIGSGQTGSGILISTLTVQALGTVGQTSALTLTINELKDSTEGTITASINDGLFTVAGDVPAISISDGSAETGVSTTVTITADDVVDLANFDITVTYDPAVVIVTDAVNDAAFGSAINNLEEAANGTVRLASLNIASGQTGSGILISTLTLQALGTTGETSALTLMINELKDSTEGTITATTNDGLFTVGEEVPELAAITVTPSSATVAVGATELFTATAYDQFGDTMAGVVITWGTYPTGFGSVDSPTAVTDSSGIATTIFTAEAEGITGVHAQNGSVVGSAAVTVIIPVELMIDWIEFNSTMHAIASAGDEVNVSVQVTDPESWQNIASVIVDMSEFGAGAAEELSLIANDTTTAIFASDIQVTQFVGSTGAQVTANASDTSGNWTGDFTSSGNLVVIPSDPYQLKILGPDGSAPNENTIYQTVAIQDQYGNNLTTASGPFSYVVTMSKTAGSATIEAPNPQTITQANTNSEGVFDSTYGITDEYDEETTIKVTSTGLIPDTKTLTFFASVDHLDVGLNKTSMYADGGQDSILVTVQLKDSSGNDIKSVGEYVQITQNTGAGLFSGLVTSQTDANGEATFVITSTTMSGSDEIYAIASSSVGTSSTITVTPIVSPANSEMKPDANVELTAGTDMSVSVTTRDYDNLVMEGVEVTFNITSGNGTLDGQLAGTPVAVVSDASGFAEVTFACTIFGDVNTIDATVKDLNGVSQKVSNAEQYTITVVPNVVNQFSVSPGDNIGLKNVPGTSQEISIQLQDAYGNSNTTAGVQILVSTDNTALGIMTNDTTTCDNNLYITTDVSGIATFTYEVNSTEAGTAILTVDAAAYDVTDTVTVTTSGPEGIYLSLDPSLPMVGDTVIATAQLTNAEGAPLAIADKNITFTVLNPDSILVGVDESPTDTDGKTTFDITPDMVNMPGVYTVTAKNDLIGLKATNTTTYVGVPVELVLEANVSELTVNEMVSLDATMKDSNGYTTSALDGYMVSFIVDDVLVEDVAVSSGVASMEYTQSTNGTVEIVVFYNGTLQDSASVKFNPEDVFPALASAITPNSRIARVGTPVTIFMSVINYGTGTASDVSISQDSSLPATISYQTWDGTSLTGTPDTPVDIAAGETVHFVLTINATAEFATSPMTFDVSSTNGATAPISAVNTLTMFASITPSPDVIMMSTDLSVSTAVDTATSFAVATMNVGTADATGVSFLVDIPSGITGLVYLVNETNPDGSIKGPATGLTIATGDTPTFAVFLTPTEAITNDPANNRITIKLVDGSGKVIGAQSIAVYTT